LIGYELSSECGRAGSGHPQAMQKLVLNSAASGRQYGYQVALSGMLTDGFGPSLVLALFLGLIIVPALPFPDDDPVQGIVSIHICKEVRKG
jgi:hypothetical protein